jgi:hypothetical protein
MRRTIATTLCLLAVALARPPQASAAEAKPTPPPAAAKSGAGSQGSYYTHYKIHFLASHLAQVLAWQQCPPDAGERCRVTPDEHGDLDVIADAATQRKIAQLLAREDAAPVTQAFQLVLLLADQQAGEPPALSKNAQKAVDDLRGFFPYKGYHLLDTAWVRTTGEANARLVGKDGVSYAVSLSFAGTGGGGAGESPGLFVRRFRLDEEPSPALLKAARAPRILLSTSFGLKVGETLVVGTSKLDGGDALVLLVTALPPA